MTHKVIDSRRKNALNDLLYASDRELTLCNNLQCLVLLSRIHSKYGTLSKFYCLILLSTFTHLIQMRIVHVVIRTLLVFRYITYGPVCHCVVKNVCPYHAYHGHTDVYSKSIHKEDSKEPSIR